MKTPRPRKTKILKEDKDFMYIYIKSVQPMVLSINMTNGETKWMYWEIYLAEVLGKE